jgi:anthranilate phosphoribosyltransferase
MSNLDDDLDSAFVLREAVSRTQAKQDLEPVMMQAIVRLMMSGQVDERIAAELLTNLYQKGEAVGELVGAAQAMREYMTPIVTERKNVIDTCGTGGGGANTFNISTAVAIVAAAAGANVAKHGNKKSTSRSGSSDVLEVLGVNIHAPVGLVSECLNELGICFCFAPLFHPSVKRIMEVRRKLPFPTVFNLLGPLCNPALAPFQLLGAGRGETQELLAGALFQLGTQNSWVVHGNNGLGELSIAGESIVEAVNSDGIRRFILTPEDVGLARQSLDSLIVDSPEQSASLILSVLNNESGPPRDIVLLNAGAALLLVGVADSLRSGIQLAAESLAAGKPRELLERLVAFTN